jgi:hypothetical protein
MALSRLSPEPLFLEVPREEETRRAIEGTLKATYHSHPRSPEVLIADFHIAVAYQPVYLLTYDMDLRRQAGRIFQSNFVPGGTLAWNGATGRMMDAMVTNFILEEMRSRPPVKSVALNAEFPEFRVNVMMVWEWAKQLVRERHPQAVKDWDFVVRDFSRVYVPFVRVDLKVSETPYQAFLMQGTSGRLWLRQSDFLQCRICGASVLGVRPILCDLCGRATHVGGADVEIVHGFQCARCGRTSCRLHGFLRSHVLTRKEALCSVCAADEELRGGKIVPLSSGKP